MKTHVKGVLREVKGDGELWLGRDDNKGITAPRIRKYFLTYEEGRLKEGSELLWSEDKVDVK